jgi:ABC-type multidrug transport system fused ATPase/permease subunit
LEFQNVWFRYPTRNRDWILQDFNLKVYKGESVGIIGQSGCGKSTFAYLILRFYDPDAGRILYKNKDLREYPVDSLREEMGFVM